MGLGGSISQIISKLETDYGTVDSVDVLLQRVYGMSQEKNKKVQAFSTRLEDAINQIIIGKKMERHLRDHPSIVCIMPCGTALIICMMINKSLTPNC